MVIISCSVAQHLELIIFSKFETTRSHNASVTPFLTLFSHGTINHGDTGQALISTPRGTPHRRRNTELPWRHNVQSGGHSPCLPCGTPLALDFIHNERTSERRRGICKGERESERGRICRVGYEVTGAELCVVCNEVVRVRLSWNIPNFSFLATIRFRSGSPRCFHTRCSKAPSFSYRGIWTRLASKGRTIKWLSSGVLCFRCT